MSRIGAGLLPAVALWMCIAMGGVTPLHGQRDATVGWIISAVHPDPTPGMVVLDVRWAGPQCAGRKRSRFQVPGYGG